MPDTEAPLINDTSMVRMVNTGTTTFRKQYAGLWYELTPGQTRMIPYYAACLWFGNPKAQNLPGGKDQDQHRRNEVRRLSTFWGTYADPWYVPAEQTDMMTSDPDTTRPYVNNRHPNLPLFELYSLEDDTRIYTVVDDPEGDRVHSASGSRMEQRNLEETVAVLNTRMTEVLEELRKSNPAAAERLTGTSPVPTAASGPILPDDDQTVGVTDDGFDEKQVADVEATEDLPPAARPARKPASKVS